MFILLATPDTMNPNAPIRPFAVQIADNHPVTVYGRIDQVKAWARDAAAGEVYTIRSNA